MQNIVTGLVQIDTNYILFCESRLNLSFELTFWSFIIQLCFLEYKYRSKRVQITDICTRLIPPGRVKFKTLASQNSGKRNRWIINLQTTTSTQALYNPYFNLQTTSQFPQHFHSFGYTSKIYIFWVSP